MEIRLEPRQVVRILGWMIVLFAVLHLISCIPFIWMGRPYPIGQLNLDAEHNLPTLYSTGLLWINALLCGLVGWSERGKGRFGLWSWMGLFLLFFMLGLDESIEIHERLIEPMRAVLGVGGLLRFAWVVPYAVFSLLLALLYARFIAGLPSDTRKYILLAVVLYGGGALGMELFGGAWIDAHGRTLVYYLLALIEEVLELAGASCFIYAFLNHIDRYMAGICLRITSSRSESSEH